MNRWWGSKSDSDQQASQREQRANERDRRSARQVIDNLDLRLSEDEFEDCNTSIQNVSIFNLDGADDGDLDESSASTMSTAAAIAAQ